MNDHVSKPIDPDALYRTLARWLASKEISYKPHASSEDEHNLPELEHFDVKTGLARVGGNAVTYRKLLIRFRDDNTDIVSRVRTEMEADPEKAASTVHTLKGVAGNVGAQAVWQACVDWEQGDPDRQVAELEERLESALFELADLSVEEDSHEGPVLGLDDLLGQLQEIAVELRNGDILAADSLEHLKPSMEALGVGEEIKALDKCVEGFELDEAAEIVERICEKLGLIDDAP